MATAAAGRHDRLFYGGMAVALALTVLGGFAATYYLRFLDGGPKATFSGGPFTTLVHAHGALFTAWMLLFIVQTALVARQAAEVDVLSGGRAWAPESPVSATSVATLERRPPQ